jgi:hypothetical protein
MFRFSKKPKSRVPDQESKYGCSNGHVTSPSKTGLQPTANPQTMNLVLPHRHGKIGMRLAVMLDQVVVMIVDEAGTAWNAGLREGDMLLQVNESEVEADVVKVVTLIKLGAFPMQLVIVRNGRLEGRVLNNRLTVFKNKGLRAESSTGAEGERISIPFSWLKKLCHRLPSAAGTTFTDVPLQEIRELSSTFRKQEYGENNISIESGVLRIDRDDLNSRDKMSPTLAGTPINRYRESVIGSVDVDDCPIENEDVGMQGELRALLAAGDITQEMYKQTMRQFASLGIDGDLSTRNMRPVQSIEASRIAGPPVYAPEDDEAAAIAFDEESAIEVDELELLSEEELREYLGELQVAHGDCGTKDELVKKLHTVLGDEHTVLEDEEDFQPAGPAATWQVGGGKMASSDSDSDEMV